MKETVVAELLKEKGLKYLLKRDETLLTPIYKKIYKKLNEIKEKYGKEIVLSCCKNYVKQNGDVE